MQKCGPGLTSKSEIQQILYKLSLFVLSLQDRVKCKMLKNTVSLRELEGGGVAGDESLVW